MTIQFNEECEATPESVGLSSKKLANLYNLAEGYVTSGKMPGIVCMVARDGKVVYQSRHGNMDDEAARPMQLDTIFRIYSMTKPIASVGLMRLYEEGLFQLDDPASAYIPELSDLRVLDKGGDADNYTVSVPSREMTVRDLLMHTSGLVSATPLLPVGKLYHRAEMYKGGTLADMVKVLGTLPLHCDPGTEWNYGISTDIVGYLCEVLSGQPLDEYLQQHILDPLGMTDTGFHVPAANADRLAACYRFGESGGKAYELQDAPSGSRYLAPKTYFSGAGGMVSTGHDYMQFCKMLAAGGELNGERVIGSRTLSYMAMNHLPDNCDLAAMGQPQFNETTMEGIGFGLGFAVLLDPAVAQVIGTPGEYYWGGAASTAFFVSPEEDLSVVFLTQLLPSGSHPIRRQLRAAVYGAITD
jgi:CubicO group peptidase (beta-lactamase class C family)